MPGAAMIAIERAICFGAFISQASTGEFIAPGRLIPVRARPTSTAGGINQINYLIHLIPGHIDSITYRIVLIAGGIHPGISGIGVIPDHIDQIISAIDASSDKIDASADHILPAT